MSGGVDSAVAAYLLKEEGYDVTGVTLRTWESADGQEGRCCEIDDAAAAARKIGIPYHAFNCMSVFDEKVIKPFVRSYIEGTTPNPCIVCNRYVKWEQMLYHADVMGCDAISTGHYAGIVRLDNGRYTVRRARHAQKDQTYMLYALTQEQLSRTLMPLGDLTKDEVRSIAAGIGLPVADKPDSQEICFVPDDDYAQFICSRHTGYLPPEGDFVDEDGNVLGRHKGIIRYTVGQRKGLGIALGRPAFVKRIDPVKNEVVLADDADLYTRCVTCTDVNLMGISHIDEDEGIRCKAKIRYHHEAADAVAKLSGDKLTLTFDEPVRAPAPGQSAVMYDNVGNILGGGVITEGVL